MEPAGWEDMLGDPAVHLDGEGAAVEAIRGWVGAAPSKPVVPADRFIWRPEDAAPSTPAAVEPEPAA